MSLLDRLSDEQKGRLQVASTTEQIQDIIGDSLDEVTKETLIANITAVQEEMKTQLLRPNSTSMWLTQICSDANKDQYEQPVLSGSDKRELLEKDIELAAYAGFGKDVDILAQLKEANNPENANEGVKAQKQMICDVIDKVNSRGDIQQQTFEPDWKLGGIALGLLSAVDRNEGVAIPDEGPTYMVFAAGGSKGEEASARQEAVKKAFLGETPLESTEQQALIDKFKDKVTQTVVPNRGLISSFFTEEGQNAREAFHSVRPFFSGVNVTSCDDLTPGTLSTKADGLNAPKGHWDDTVGKWQEQKDQGITHVSFLELNGKDLTLAERKQFLKESVPFLLDTSANIVVTENGKTVAVKEGGVALGDEDKQKIAGISDNVISDATKFSDHVSAALTGFREGFQNLQQHVQPQLNAAREWGERFSQRVSNTFTSCVQADDEQRGQQR